MSLKKICLSLFFLIFSTSTVAETIFKNGTEYPTKKWGFAANKTAFLIVNSMDESGREMLDANLQEKNLRREYSRYLVFRKISPNNSKRHYEFVRPTLRPYVSAFYGAHAFSYWLVSNGKIIYTGFSDYFAMLSDVHEGNNDIVISNFAGGWMYNSKLLYAEGSYKETTCWAHPIVEPAHIVDCEKVPGRN